MELRKKRLIELKEKHDKTGLTNEEVKELLGIADNYQTTLKDINQKGGYVIRGI